VPMKDHQKPFPFVIFKTMYSAHSVRQLERNGELSVQIFHAEGKPRLSADQFTPEDEKNSAEHT
jgi:hypothetical protein